MKKKNYPYLSIAVLTNMRNRSLKKKNYPYLECFIEVVKHESEAPASPAPKPASVLKPVKPVSLKIVGPPTFKIFYANNGDLPSFTAYLCTYCYEQDQVTSAWKYHIFKKEILSLQPGAAGFFEYDAPAFAKFTSGHPIYLASKPILPTPAPATKAIKYRLVSMLYDPIHDPLPDPVENYFTGSIMDDRHVKYSPELTSWPLL
jgi:hypothetical protein